MLCWKSYNVIKGKGGWHYENGLYGDPTLFRFRHGLSTGFARLGSLNTQHNASN